MAWRLTSGLRCLAHEGLPAHPASPDRHDRDALENIPDSSIVFRLSQEAIVITRPDRHGTHTPLFEAIPRLLDNTSGKLDMDHVPVEIWQVSRRALERLFFRLADSYTPLGRAIVRARPQCVRAWRRRDARRAAPEVRAAPGWPSSVQTAPAAGPSVVAARWMPMSPSASGRWRRRSCADAATGVVARIVTGPHDAHRLDLHLPMRYDTGRPRAIIRFRISQPRTTSLPCPAGLRARRLSPMMDL